MRSRRRVRTWCSPSATSRGAGMPRPASRDRPKSGALDLADLASVRSFAASWTGDIHVLVNNAGRDGAASRPHRRWVRAAVRHEPPRPLRPDEPAASARHRPCRHRGEQRAPLGHDRLRRPQLGDPPLWRGRRSVRAVEARQPALHARVAAPARGVGFGSRRDRCPPRHDRDQPHVELREPGAVVTREGRRAPVRAGGRDGRDAHPVRRDRRCAGRQLRRTEQPARDGGASRGSLVARPRPPTGRSPRASGPRPKRSPACASPPTSSVTRRSSLQHRTKESES